MQKSGFLMTRLKYFLLCICPYRICTVDNSIEIVVFCSDGVIEEIILCKIADNDVASELHKFASAIEKRHEFKQTKSTPSSLEFNVKKPTPKVMEPRTSPGPTRPLQETRITVKSPDSDRDSPQPDTEVPREKQDESWQAAGATGESDKKRSPEREKQSPGQQPSGVLSPERQSPEHTLDSSTDSVPPSLESSIESSQTCTSSLESSSLSPPLDDSASSEKEGSDTVFESSYPKTYPQAMVVPQAVRTPPARKVPQHAEVAGSHFDKNEPQLVAIRKIDSVRLPDLVRLLILLLCFLTCCCLHVLTQLISGCQRKDYYLFKQKLLELTIYSCF